MVNKPLIRPYFWGGGSFGGVARIPMTIGCNGLRIIPISIACKSHHRL